MIGLDVKPIFGNNFVPALSLPVALRLEFETAGKCWKTANPDASKLEQWAYHVAIRAAMQGLVITAASAQFVVVEEVLVTGPTAAFSIRFFFAPRQRKFSN